MIVSIPTTARPQQRYDHRLRDLVQRTGGVTVATYLGVPRSTARGWLGAAPTVVVCLDVVDLTEPELRQEVLKLRRRVQKLSALLRLALALLRTELSPRTFCTFRRELSSLRRTVSRRRTARNVLEALSGVSEGRMIIPMTTTGRLQQRYDHRLRDLVQGTGT